MRITRIYSTKEDFESLDKITHSFTKIENYFKRHDDSLRINYDNNIKTLKIYEFKDMMEGNTLGLYYESNNRIRIEDLKLCLTHELVHMASNDRNHTFFLANNEFSEFKSLGEGMTEFMASVIEKRKPKIYFWESFVAMMLIMSNNSAVKTFFEGSSDKFI